MPASKKGGTKKGRQQAHHKLTGKYVRQRTRTTANKKKEIARQKAIRKVKLQNRIKKSLCQI